MLASGGLNGGFASPASFPAALVALNLAGFF